ncbi:kelch repeat BTB domain-containing protein [Fusarium mexicanum]|uniref:Kelch repeat BTB domain-containing protein n=1 Tax=Fusarium mexicanum TaxID=751941 RepID=A0A8H5JL12_9HYPO|nr:kelch repeat BTB domain-containing protein [Fusarium mexicanum]
MGSPMDYRQEGRPSSLFNTSENCHEYLKDLPEMLKTGKYSDLTIVCGNNRYQVHRNILCARSKFFDVSCDRDFKESNGVIELPDDDPAAVQKMIGYIYNIEYAPTTTQMLDNDDDIEAELSDTDYDAAERYRLKLFGAEFVERKRIKQLKERKWASWKVEEPTLSSQLSLHAKVYGLGEKYRIEGLKKEAQRKFESEIQSGNVGVDDFAEAVEEVYTSTVSDDRGLRDVVVKMIELDVLLLDHAVVREVMRATEFALDVLLYMSQGLRSQARFKDSPQTSISPLFRISCTQLITIS